MPKQTFKWTIGRKLTLGFAAVVAVLLTMATSTLVQLRGLGQDRQLVLHHDMPMQALAMQISGEVHAALSAHRGYIILGLDELKQDRADIWLTIHDDVDELSELVNGDVATQAMVTELKDILDDFESSQMRIVQVAHTPANEPASVLFAQDTLPHGEKMREHLQAILAAEKEQPATAERRTLMGCVGDAELHLMRVTAAVSQYLNVATEEQLNNVHAEVAACSASVATLKTHLDLMTDGQRQDFDAYIAAREQYLANAKRVIAIRSAPDWNQAQYICSNTVTPLAKEAEAVLENIIAQASSSTQTHAASLNERGDWVHDLTLYAAFAAVLAAMAIAWALRHAICPPIIRAADAAKRVAEGDLTVQIPATSQDECGDLGRSFNEMVDKVADMIRHVAETSQEVNDASSQIADTAQEMASGMQAQNEQIAEVSRAVEDMALSVAEVADKSASAATNAQASGQAATDGGHVVDATVDQMRAISAAVDQSAQAVTQLGQRGQQIGQIVAVINDIAEQTNLLALNAAIESARAGEHGRGFAVVADEVRKLADRTTQATQEIAESITAIQSETQAAVDNMNTGSQQVTSGVTKASEAGTALGAIVEHANAVADMVQSIAATTQTQSATSERLNRNLGAITSVTAAAHEGSEHAAEAAMRLSDKSDELLRLVSQFKVKA